MTNPSQLVSVFMPPLAVLLAQQESAKGASLTEAEVLRIRDDASCVMLEPAEAHRMVQSRGYRDVNPDNCWADWHRIRVQATGRGVLPKIIMCLPGGVDFPSRCGQIVKHAGVEHTFRSRSERIIRGFKVASANLKHPLSTDEMDLIHEHTSVLFVMSKNFPQHEAAGIALGFLRLGRMLLDSGGWGMKCESSGIAHGRTRWIELAAQADRAVAANNAESPRIFWTALFLAFVQFPIGDETELFSCGMHLLGKPDLIIADEDLEAVTPEDQPIEPAVISLFHAFAIFLLTECGEEGFISGHTFSVDDASPRFRVIWETCGKYKPDNLFFNPYGRLRFTAV